MSAKTTRHLWVSAKDKPEQPRPWGRKHAAGAVTASLLMALGSGVAPSAFQTSTTKTRALVLPSVKAKFTEQAESDPAMAPITVSGREHHLLQLRDADHTADQHVHLVQVVNRQEFALQDLLEWHSVYAPEPGLSEWELPNISWLIHLAREIDQAGSSGILHGLFMVHSLQKEALADRQAGYSYTDLGPALAQPTLNNAATCS